MVTAEDIQNTPMRERGVIEAIAALPRDIQLALTASALLFLQIEGSFLLGASGPDLTLSMWLVVLGYNLVIALGISLGILRDRRITLVFLWAAGLLATAWTLPYNILAAPLVFFSLFALVPAAVLFCAAMFLLSLIRHEQRGRGFFTRLVLLAVLLTITILCILPSPGSWAWQLDYGALLFGLRTSATSRVDLRDLQSTAIELLERESRRPAEEKPLWLNERQFPADLPEPIRQLHPRFVRIVPAWGQDEAYVDIFWGYGIMPTWGVKLGRPTFRLAPGERVRQWRDGVYGYRGD